MNKIVNLRMNLDEEVWKKCICVIIQEVGREVWKKCICEIIQEVGREVWKKCICEIIQEVGREVWKKCICEIIQEVGREVWKKCICEIIQEVGREVWKVGFKNTGREKEYVKMKECLRREIFSDGSVCARVYYTLFLLAWPVPH